METVSLAAETLMLVPQVMRNRADGNAEILSQVFVAVLLVADTLKVAQYGAHQFSVLCFVLCLCASERWVSQGWRGARTCRGSRRRRC